VINIEEVQMSKMRRKIVAGNWKENGNLALVRAFNVGLTKASIDNVNVVICPPFPYLQAVESSQRFALGAQDISLFENGAHTGQVAGEMLCEVGCQYVIVGHSERRTECHETNNIVAEKTMRALASNLTPIVCFGEPELIRTEGNLFDYLDAQLKPVFEQVGSADVSKLVLAYEPIWAIGTGLTASPEQAQEVHKYVRRLLAQYSEDAASSVSILYGGSVKADNAEALFSQPDIDGGLIGGASLQLAQFLAICRSA